jgi:hypothetical protein
VALKSQLVLAGQDDAEKPRSGKGKAGKQEVPIKHKYIAI